MDDQILCRSQGVRTPVEGPVRVIWGLEDRLLSYPRTARCFRGDWLPNADWVEMPDVGHCPQLDVPLETTQLILGFTGPSRSLT